MCATPVDDEPESSDSPLHPPFGYQDIVGEGWTCVACGVTIPKNDVLTKHHLTWHRELDRQLSNRPK